MGSWASGPGMIQEPELEEGEACYYRDDRRMDPDITLSYIGDRVQSLLGHFQKDFEGGVSAENLGAKFGGYGSFLPMHQRSPIIPSQSKSPHKGSAPNSTQLSDAPATQRNGFSFCSPRIVPSKNFKISSMDPSIKERPFVYSHKDADAFTGKSDLPSSKSDNPTEQRTLKVRLKLGSEMVAQYNDEIHGLGLTSPSLSTEDCPKESARLKLEHCETPYESPAKILQIMTSFLVSGGSLLSPLSEDFLSLGRYSESSARSEYKTNPGNSAISLGFENKDALKEKKAKSADKYGNVEKSENGCIPDLNDSKKITSGIEALGCKLQPLNGLNSRPLSDTVCSTNEPLKEAVSPPDVVRGSKMDVPPDNARGFEKDVPLKKRKGSKDRLNVRSVSSNLVENASLGCTPTQSYSNYDQKESRCNDGHKFGKDPKRVSENNISVKYGLDSRNRFKSSCDVSDGESVKLAMNKFSLKVGMKVKSGEQDNLGLPLVGNKFPHDKKPKATEKSAMLLSKSADISRDGGCAAPKVKNSGKKKSLVNLKQKDVLDTSIQHMNNPNHLLERPSGDRSKYSNVDGAKEETGYTDKFKKGSSNKKYTDKITSETHVIEPPAEVIPAKEGVITGKEGTVVDPVLIQEDWVCCDRCEAWRLLPYGTKSNQLPDKWVCSMLNWLPGMNSCDVSEDDTTNAARASLSVPITENNYNVQAHTDTSVSGVTSVDAHHFTPNHQNFTSDKVAFQAKKQNLKEGSNTVGMSYVVPSNNVQKNFQHHSMNSTKLKEVNHTLTGPEATKEYKLQHPKKSATSIGKLNKRKDENLRKDFANPRKKIKKESFQHVQGMVKKIKSKGAVNVDNFQAGGNLDLVYHNLNSDLPCEEAVKEEKKLSLRKESSFREKGNLHVHVKKQKDQMHDLPDGELLNINESNRKEVSTKKRKFMDCDNREHREEVQRSIKKEEKDFDFQRVQKSRVSQIDDEFKRSTGDDSSKRKVAKDRVISSISNEKSTNSVFKEKQQPKNLKLKLSLTKEDIDELRKDLGCEEFPMAATSSCSKISDSRKNRVGLMEVKGSPEESVSSFPMRIPYLNQVLPVTLASTGKIGSRVNEFAAMGNEKKSLGMNRNSELRIMRKRKTAGVCHVKSLKDTAGFRESIAAEIPCGEHISSGNLPCEFLETPSVDNKSSILEQRGQLHPSLLINCINGEGMSMGLSKAMSPLQNTGKRNRTHGERLAEKVSGPSTGLEILDLKEKLKEETDVADNYHVQSEVLSNVKHSFSDESSIKSVHHGKSATLVSGFVNENFSNLPLSTVLKEVQDALKKAEELKSHANLIKTSGFGSESNYEYLKAALQFLHGASLLEAYNGECIKNLDTNLIQTYGTAAKLCETCASEYEKSCELAAAALAYKCVEVAYLKIVYCKSSSTRRIWRDLQSSMQILQQGESPSSSGSDVDNLNNLVVVDRASSKGNDSHALNHVTVPRNRANLAWLLDFTKDVKSAMEAAKKSQDTFKAAHVKFKESQNKEAIASVKRVIDFSFQDVEELINSVWLAFDAINRQATSRARE